MARSRDGLRTVCVMLDIDSARSTTAGTEVPAINGQLAVGVAVVTVTPVGEQPHARLLRARAESQPPCPPRP
jgi:hypothetical protein